MLEAVNTVLHIIEDVTFGTISIAIIVVIGFFYWEHRSWMNRRK